MLKGHVHSIESFGAVDGPDIRMVVFSKGCSMRCLYYRNPGTWEVESGTDMSVEEVLCQYKASRHFCTNGGITVASGGPLMQIDFVTELFQTTSHRGIHICLDTSDITFSLDSLASMEKMGRLMTVTDLVMLDIKHISLEEHRKLTSQSNERILQFARYLGKKPIPIWTRHVVMPGITDNRDYLYQLGTFIGGLHNVRALDVLPYRDIGKMKYENLRIDYPLNDTPPLTKEEGIGARKVMLSGIRDERSGKAN